MVTIRSYNKRRKLQYIQTYIKASVGAWAKLRARGWEIVGSGDGVFVISKEI